MLVVSDTSALSNLAIIDRLDLLREQFGSVHMPPAVAAELKALRDSEAGRLLTRAVHDGWLLTLPLPEEAPFPTELHGLDAGETEALRLALFITADRVLMDEQEGRQRASSLGIRTIGVLGVLLSARKAGVIPSLKDEILKLRRDARFFISKPLEAQLLAAAGE
jgi:predicted nucleic acid-binding protein